MLKPKLTTRKFYNKWLYKVTLRVPGVAIFRLFKLEDVPNLDFKVGSSIHSTKTKAANNKTNIILLSKFLLKWDATLWAKRIEQSNIDIYTNDKELYAQLLSKFTNTVSACSEPDESNLDLLEKSGCIIAKKLPHDRYHFKAFLLPHKIKDKESKKQFLDWIDGQGDRILISDSVKKWFIDTNWNWDRRYLLIEDEQTLLMLKLRNSEAIGRVYDYVISDK